MEIKVISKSIGIRMRCDNQTVTTSVTSGVDWQKIRELIAESITHSSDVINVLTAAATAPATASDGYYYINTSSNKLYKYTEGAWAEEEAKDSVVYITADNSHIYLWNGSEFVDVASDNIIKVTDVETQLDDYTTPGIYRVLEEKSITSPVEIETAQWYILFVEKDNIGSTRRLRQRLLFPDGYLSRVFQAGGPTQPGWSAWEEYRYAETVQGATAGNFAGLGSNGNITDSGKKASDFAASVHTHTIADVTDLQATLDELRALAYAGL